MLYNKPPVTIEVKDTGAIDRLGRTVDSLTKAHIALQTDFNNKQTTLIDNTVKQNKKHAKKIIDIPKLSNPERDSIWAKINTSEDSIPGGYWDILKQKTGGRSPKDL